MRKKAAEKLVAAMTILICMLVLGRLALRPAWVGIQGLFTQSMTNFLEVVPESADVLVPYENSGSPQWTGQKEAPPSSIFKLEMSEELRFWRWEFADSVVRTFDRLHVPIAKGDQTKIDLRVEDSTRTHRRDIEEALWSGRLKIRRNAIIDSQLPSWPTDPDGFLVFRKGTTYEYRPDWYWFIAIFSVCASLGLVSVALASGAALSWRRASRVASGRCVKCGYPRVNQSGPCPECGLGVSQPDENTAERGSSSNSSDQS